LSHTSNRQDKQSNILRLTGNDGVHFGFDLKPEVDAHLQRAASLVASREQSLQALKDAEKAAPDQLEVLVALFKFYFYQGETETAEKLVFRALKAASEQGQFSQDWTCLTPQSTDWEDPRAPGRIYLYSLKALAFIRLRQDRIGEAEAILSTLAQLDPSDQVGADVIRDMLNGITEDLYDG
jgi:tetratricopeptide (TPR) repeat protein